MKKQEVEKSAALKRAYNAAASVVGEFNPFGMTEREMLVKALNHQGVETDRETEYPLGRGGADHRPERL